MSLRLRLATPLVSKISRGVKARAGALSGHAPGGEDRQESDGSISVLSVSQFDISALRHKLIGARSDRRNNSVFGPQNRIPADTTVLMVGL